MSEQSIEKDFTLLNQKIQEVAKAFKELNELREQFGVDSLVYYASKSYSDNEADEAYEKICEEVEREFENQDSKDLQKTIDERFQAWEEIRAKNAAAISIELLQDLEGEIDCAGWSTSSSHC